MRAQTRFKFIHAADVHLDSPLRGLERYEGAPVDELRRASRDAFDAMVALAIEEEVAFVIIAGDLYDGKWRDYNTGLYLVGQLAKLREAGIDAYILAGNHDAESQITQHLSLPQNTSRFGSKGPQTFSIEDLGVDLHGQSYAHRDVSLDLSEAYPDPTPGRFNIGVLHTALNGREGHAPYAPCSLEALKNKGYNYWALGHVHKREVLSEDPWIVFPGNLQGRHIKETGAKGCSLVTVEDHRVVDISHEIVDVLRWADCHIDISQCSTESDIITMVGRHLETEVAMAEGRLVAARVRLTGVSQLHSALASDWERWVGEVRAKGVDLGQVWIEQVRLESRPQMDVAKIAARDDALGSLLKGFGEEVDPEVAEALIKALAPLANKIHSDLKSENTALRALEDPNHPAMVSLWQGARQLVIGHLMTGEDPS